MNKRMVRGDGEPWRWRFPFLTLALALGISAAAEPVATSALSAQAYVQSGLVAQWDAIENAGYGLHDSEPSSWTELVKGVTVTHSGSLTYNPTNVYFNGSAYFSANLPAVKTALAMKSLTVELFLRPEAYQQYAGYLHVGDSSSNRELVFDMREESGSLSAKGAFSGLQYAQSGWYDTAHCCIPINTKSYFGKNTLATIRVGSEGAKVAFDAGANVHTNCGKGVAPTSDLVGIGWYHSNNKAKFNLYSTRFYSRELTDAEVAWNNMIDRHRFLGAALDASVSCVGRRVSEGVAQQSALVSCNSTSLGTVSLSDGTTNFGKDEPLWLPFGSTKTLTYRASPAAGCSFVWTGDTDGFSDAQLTATNLELSASVSRRLTAVFHAPATRRWVGGTSVFASEAANWVDGDGQAVDAPPMTGDAIVLDGDSGSGEMVWDLPLVQPGSWTQTVDYQGTARLMVGTSRATAGSLAADGVNRELKVTGDVVINGGYLTCGTNTQLRAKTDPEAVSSDEGNYRLWLTATGNVTVGSGATVDVSRCGFYYGIGTGYHSSACGHGAVPTTDAVRNYATCYGNLFKPTEIGAGGSSGYGNLGAGAVKITAGGTLTVNGAVDATPSVVKHNGIYASYYLACGGSVWLTAARMAGTGRVAACGGPADKKDQGSTSAAAAGGRIALYLTDPTATFDDLGWTVDCRGSYNNGALSSAQPGTIYRQLATDEDQHGEIVIAGGGIVGYQCTALSRTCDDKTNYTYCTPLKSEGTTSFRFRRISLADASVLGVLEGTTLDLTGTEIAASAGKNQDAIALIGGTLRLPGDTYAFTNAQLWSIAPSRIEFTSANGLGTLILQKECRFDSPIGIPGSLVVSNKIYHSSQETGHLRYWTEITTTNDLTILSTGSINVDARGYRGASSPGYGGVTSIGGSYGGMGHGSEGKCYGDPRDPQDCGGYGNGAGGGLVKLHVGGTLSVTGVVTSCGANAGGAGAGGGINITAGRLVGNGKIRAGGGCTYLDNQYTAPYSLGTASYSGGGGGRIAITLTDVGATFDDYTGNLEAPGSTNNPTETRRAGNGTIYLRLPGEKIDEGTLIIKSVPRASAPAAGLGAGIHAAQDGVTVGKVVISRCGALQIQHDCTLNVKGDFTNDNTGCVVGDLGDAESVPGTVAFTDAAVKSTITGTNDFARLLCAAPGKTLRFGGDQSLCRIVSGGTLAIAGTSAAPVLLRGISDSVVWYIAMSGSADLLHADVAYSDASAGATISVPAADNADSGDNVNWNFYQPIVPGEEIRWTGGAGDGMWANAANWDRLRTPVETDSVVIPCIEGTPPTIAVSVAVGRLMVEANATLLLNGQNLTVTNGVACAGSLVCSGSEILTLSGDVTLKGFTAASSTLNLLGTAARTVDLGGQSYWRVVVGTDGPSLAFTEGFSAQYLTCACDAAFMLRFGGGKTFTFGQCTFDGVVNDAAALTLASYAAGVAWKLNVTGKMNAAGVIVSDSASQTPVVAVEPSTDGLGNVNWRFGVVQSTWQGASGGRWSDGANWSSGKAPDANTFLAFDADATIDMDVDNAAALLIEVGAATVTLTGAKPLSITSYLEVQSGGTLVQAMTNEAEIAVGGSVFVRDGGTWTHPANGTAAANYGRDHGYGIRATVAGDVLIDAGGKITAYGKGYHRGYGPGCNNPSHGTSYGVRYSASALACYGSMFSPTDLGSGGHQTYGAEAGGRIRMTVAGTLTVNGELGATGTPGGCYNATGGSVWLTAGALAGSGHVHADGALDALGSTGHAGQGGRLAVYLTGDGDFSGFTGTLSAYGGFEENTETPSSANCGTIYLKEKAKHGVVKLRNKGVMVGSCTGGVDLPVTNRCPDRVRSYASVTFDVAEGGVLYLTRNVTIEELELDNNCRVNLNGHTLTIRSRKHKDRQGWPTKWMYNDRGIYPGTDASGNPGKIVWATPPLCVLIR